MESAEINFFWEGITTPDFYDEVKIRRWLFLIADQYDKSIKTLNYIFSSDDYVLEINKTYLQHDYYTDIITFPYQEGEFLESDIFISIDRIVDNASTLKIPVQDEFIRVISHGLLHLCGLKDKSEQEQKEMRKAENEAIAIYKNSQA